MLRKDNDCSVGILTSVNMFA